MEFRITGDLGGTYRRLGQPKKAIENYEQTQEIAREFNDLRLESEYLLSYGLACTYSGDLKAGVAHANRLLEISTEAGEVKFEAQAYDCYSLVYLAAGRLDETIEYCDKSMRIYESENNRNGAMYVLNVRGMAEVGKNQLTEAIRTLEQARKMASDEDYPRLEGFCLFNLACAYRKLGEMDKALEAATKAREILAKLQAAESEPAKMLADSIRAANEGRRLDEARSLLDCSRCSITTPDIYDSDYFAEQAREIAQSEGSPELVAQADELIERKLQALILPD
jgi:tetratricopeptide (TPR) repeat protein